MKQGILLLLLCIATYAVPLNITTYWRVQGHRFDKNRSILHSLTYDHIEYIDPSTNMTVATVPFDTNISYFNDFYYKYTIFEKLDMFIESDKFYNETAVYDLDYSQIELLTNNACQYKTYDVYDAYYNYSQIKTFPNNTNSNTIKKNHDKKHDNIGGYIVLGCVLCLINLPAILVESFTICVHLAYALFVVCFRACLFYLQIYGAFIILAIYMLFVYIEICFVILLPILFIIVPICLLAIMLKM